MRNRIDLRDKCAVVTGGASGLGRAIVERLVSSGARVVVWDLAVEYSDESSDALGDLGSVQVEAVNVADFDDVSRATAATEQKLGRIDVLVNSAGITCPPNPIDEYRIDDWRQVIDVDLSGTFFCCRAVLPRMIEQRYGRVVNIASMAGKDGNPQETAYAAAKAGVIGLTKALGKETAPSGVLVNAVAPGIFETRMRTSGASEDLVGHLLDRTPVGRPGRGDELAALVAWMVSGECSFTSGFTFDASGGRATY